MCNARAHAYVFMHTETRDTHKERERERGSLQYYPVISCTIVRVKPQSISGTLIRLAVLSVSHSVRFTHTQTHTRARLSGAEIAHFILRLCHFALLVYFVIFFFHSSFFLRQPHSSLCFCLFQPAIPLHLVRFSDFMARLTVSFIFVVVFFFCFFCNVDRMACKLTFQWIYTVAHSHRLTQ